jgi:CHAT domain-containing protein/tetratricopeptide (TPR) repeat protein
MFVGAAVGVSMAWAGEPTWNELNALAGRLLAEERYGEATSAARQALAAAEKLRGGDHPQVAASLNNLAILLEAQEKYGEAEALYRRALGIRERASGDENADVAASLGNLALLCATQGECAKAEAYQRRAVATWEKLQGGDHPQTAAGLELLSELCRLQGKYGAAEALQVRALRIRETVLGPLHPDTAASLASRAALLTAIERHAEAASVSVRLCESRVRQIAEVFPFCPEVERCAVLGAFQAGHDAVCSLLMDRLSPGSLTAATGFGYILAAQGVVQDLFLEDALAAALSKAPATADGFRELREARGRMVRLMMQAAGGAGASDVLSRTSALRSAAYGLEESLAARSPRLAASREGRSATLLNVAAALPGESALVAFVRYRAFDFLPRDGSPRTGAYRYAAYVVRGGESAPDAIALGEAWKIEERVRRYRKALDAMAVDRALPKGFEGDKADDPHVRVFRNLDGTLDFVSMRNRRVSELNAASDALSRAVWLPLMPALTGVSRVFIVPDGELHFVSFAGLRDDKGRFAVEDYRLAYLSAGRDLARSAASSPTSSVTAVIFAAPDLARLPRSEETAFRSRPPAPALFGGVFPDQSGTKGEAEAVAAILTGEGIRADVRVGSEATEAALKAVVRPRILHLGTSAFVLPDGRWAREGRIESRLAGSLTVGSADLTRLRRENPLHRSGVLLAGANETLGGKRSDGGEDGVVTAEELGGLDLLGTELVILAACEVRAGQALGGEGILGLRRAFVQAGASGLVLPLWRADDGAMRDLMIGLYRRCLSGNRPVDALTALQREALARQRTLGGEPNPFDWAGFVAGGVGVP